MNNKLELWTVTVVKRDNDRGLGEEQFMYEFDKVDQMKEYLKELKDSNQDMDYVTIFPPNTGFIGSNFLV